MAVDWCKNGRFATFGPGDASYMTCVSNDLGFETIYDMQIARHGQLGDVLFAISSSGMSENILRGVKTAVGKRMNVITLSGFHPDNDLRQMGAINFYVPSDKYGTVEVAHLAILHSILDEVMANDRTS
jgi:D-sedoheptulose 7-phosphate isomerase